MTGVGTLLCGMDMTKSSNTDRNVSIDFVLVMDDSSSMKDQQNWILDHIPLLNTGLKVNNIGVAEGYPNKFQLIAFGGNPNDNGVNYQSPHFVTPDLNRYDPETEANMDVTFETTAELTSAINNLENFRFDFAKGSIENAFETLNYALDNMQIRSSDEMVSFITLLVFVTNEDANDYTEAKFTDLALRLREIENIIPTFIPLVRRIETIGDSNVNFAVANSPSSDTLEVLDNSNTISSRGYGAVKITPGDNENIKDVKTHYADLVMCSEKESGSVWNLGFVDDNPTNAAAFANGFLSLSKDAIVRGRDLMRCTYCYCDSENSNGCIEINTVEFCSCLNTDVNQRNEECSCVVNSIDTLARTGKTTLSDAEVDVIKGCDPNRGELGGCRNYIVS